MIDLRRLRVGIEVDGGTVYYSSDDGMSVSVQGRKTSTPTENECHVMVINPRKSTRDSVLTSAGLQQPKVLTIEFGRQSTGLSQLFVGDIVNAEILPPPDIALVVQANTAAGARYNITSHSPGVAVPLSTIAARVASDMGLTLSMQARDRDIRNWYHNGPAAAQVARIDALGDVRAYVDDRTLIVQDKDKARTGQIKILSQDTGMVGIPRLADGGLTVSYLADGVTEVGGMLRVESKLHPAANGDWVILQLSFVLSSYDDEYTYTAECERI